MDMMTKAAAVLLVLLTWSGSAHAFGAGAAGFGGAGVADPLKYYPVCPRGPAADSCQCRRTGAENANQLCRPGEFCNTRNGICGPGAPPRR
jgi:hypothetical protein